MNQSAVRRGVEGRIHIDDVQWWIKQEIVDWRLIQRAWIRFAFAFGVEHDD